MYLFEIRTNNCKYLNVVWLQRWQFNAGGELSNDLASLCATHVTDPSDDRDVRQIVMAQKCHRPNDDYYEQFKTWHFVLA